MNALPSDDPLRATVSMIRPTDSPVMPEKNAQRQRAADDERNSLRAVGVLGDRHLQGERGDRRQGDDRQRRRDVDVEALADVREQDAERRSVEFVDGVQPEQDEQRERGLAAADAAQPLHRVGHAELESPPHRRVVDRDGGGWFSSGSAVAVAVTVDSVRR